MTERRGPLTYTGAALIIAGSLICGLSLALHNGDGGGALWEAMITRQKVMLVGVLLIAAVLAVTAMASRAPWPRALSGVFAGIATGWFLVWDSWEVQSEYTGVIVSIVGGLLLLAGAVISAFAATADRSSATSPAGAAFAAPAMSPQPTPRTTATPQMPATPQTTATPAGWYPDPSSPGTLRYWDGSGWTEHVAPA